MDVLILRDLKTLQPWIPAWRNLPLANPFSRWEFAQHWLTQNAVAPYVLGVRGGDGELLALAPWSLRKKAGGIRLLEGIWGYDAWYHDPWIKDPHQERAIADALVAALHRHQKDWDALDLTLNAACSPHLVERLKELGWGFTTRPAERQSRLAEVGNDWETYWKSRSKDFRSSLRGAQRKLDQLPHRYMEADHHSVHPMIETAIQHSQSRWDPDHQRDLWYQAIRDLAEGCFSRGELQAYAIEIEGRLAAVTLAFQAGDRAYGTLQCYDPEFSAYRIGSLLNAWAFQKMAAAGIRSIDMGDGNIPWKDRFQTGTVETVLVTLGASLTGKAFIGWKNGIIPRLAELRGSPAR